MAGIASTCTKILCYDGSVKLKPNTHCHYCGTKYASTDYPFSCPNEQCRQKVWLNPFPIVVVAVPLTKDAPVCGFLGVRRNIHPVGELCMPGGYIERHESWQEAGIRETLEESGVIISKVSHSDTISIDGFLAVLALSEAIPLASVDLAFNNEETQELMVLDKPMQLAFKIQTAFLRRLHDQLPTWEKILIEMQTG